MYRTAPLDAPLVVAVSGSAVVAYDRRDGAVAWRFPLASSNRLHQICPRVAVERDAVVIVSGSELADTWSAQVSVVVTCLDYATGALRWQRTSPGLRAPNAFVVSLLVDQDQIFVATADELSVYALDSGAPLWTTELDAERSLSRASALAVPGAAVQGGRDNRG